MNIKIKKTRDDIETPRYQTEGSAGFDLASSIDKLILPGQTVLIPTGLFFEIPKGYELQIRPRSGVSLNTKIRISNAPGTVDSDFRGEVSIILENTGNKPLSINNGQRIAQGVLSEYARADFEIVDNLEETERSSNGFGSTDKQ
jgi:dUTP pyrophosphatase